MSETMFFDTSSNFHPYECDRAGKCVHCDRQKVAAHDPATCALCDPDYDGMPNTYRPRETCKVILVRIEVKHEHEVETQMISESMSAWVEAWAESLDAWSVEVVNEDPA